MMNALLGKKILFALVPLFLLVFLALSGGVIWGVAKTVETDTEHNLKRIARINEAKLNARLANMHVTVASTAMALANLDPSAPQARLQGDRLVGAMLENEYIYNAWAAFEPNAFDANDRAHREDYPGAPSGRYIRSYARGVDGKIEVMEDMDEDTLDDTALSPWYTTPRDSGKLFSDIMGAAFYDYGTGEGGVHSVTVSMPIFRNGKVIGVAGGDVLTRHLVQDSTQAGGITSFILSPKNLSVIYAPDNRLIGMSIEKLFAHFAELKTAIQSQQELFLEDETIDAFGEASFVYLRPVYLHPFDAQLIYIGVALPTSVVSGAVREASLPITGALLIMLMVFSALFLFVTRHISLPIRRLCVAMDAMAAGQMNVQAPGQGRRDEIGVMARSLRYMQQQFKMRYAIMQRARKKLDLHLILNVALYESMAFEVSLRRVLRVIRIFFGADMASFMILSIGRSRLFALSGKAGEFNARSLSDGPEFEAHTVLAAALQGRDYLLLKAGSQGMSDMLNLAEIAPKARAACVIPVRTEGGVLRAYLILESRHPGQAIAHDDEILDFIAARLSCFFMRHETEVRKQLADAATHDAAAAPMTLPALEAILKAPSSPVAPESTPELAPESAPKSEPKSAPAPDESGEAAETEPLLLAAVRRLPGLDVNRAIFMMGGDTDLYFNLLPVVVREINAALEKMERFLAQGDDHAFAILVHGIKGALNNIGALELGEAAYKLEMAAKSIRLEECRERYPEFARSLRAFSKALAEILDGARAARTRGASKAKGDLGALRVELEDIRAALENYDLTRANERLEYVRQFSYAPEGAPAGEASIDARLEQVSQLLASIEYEEASAVIADLLMMLRGGAS
jgi:HPt (histidine-containing phosphotransfer) domain-containing protein/HAMP domain-containing protein